MNRTYEFYEINFGMKFYEVDRIKDIIESIEKGIIIEKEVRSLGENGL